MKITRLRARRFRGFHAEFTLQLPNGQNVLLYGDNGSGKSSLADALKHFLVDRAAVITPYRNISRRKERTQKSRSPTTRGLILPTRLCAGTAPATR